MPFGAFFIALKAPRYTGVMKTYYTFEEDSLGEGSPCCGYKMPPHPTPKPRPYIPPIPCQASCNCMSCSRGAIRQRNPECPMLAVIPAITVEDVSGIKNIADCFVHVSNINTTFYIDDKHRMIITWAGPVEIDDYDYENNPLKLRSQDLFDYYNGRMVHYDKLGRAMVFSADVESQEL